MTNLAYACWEETSEEYDYQYDTSGRLLQSTFAQTPEPGFTPATGQTYYDGSHPASSRVRANYTYDGAGRTTDLTYYAENWNGSSFTDTALYENSATYDPALGLKTSSYNAWQGGPSWTEDYSYDPNFDYLTAAHYNDGNPNPDQSWSYDAAGNRNDSVCDDLNRPTSINGVSCTSDILGNRLTTGSTSMGWDCLNRMTSLTNSSGSWVYNYRADGMRVSKTKGINGTLYRYDGQMAMEDVDTGSTPAVTDYAIGARGIDAISKTSGGHTVVVYPIYDAHGNMMADVSRNGSSFSINDKRSYDAWGNIRSGASTGDPKGRYCANLGHVEDDESNLIYMRARYYDPTSGRFLSEDPLHDGDDWFTYCDNMPSNVDPSGKSSNYGLSYEDWYDIATGCLTIALATEIIGAKLVGMIDKYCAEVIREAEGWSKFAGLQGAEMGLLGFTMYAYSKALGNDQSLSAFFDELAGSSAAIGALVALGVMLSSAKLGSEMASAGVVAFAGEVLAIEGEMVADGDD